VTQYSLSLGSSAGASDIYSASQGASTSVTVNNIPTDGRTVYVRLTSTINGSPQTNDYTYTAATVGGGGCGTPAGAVITSPAPGTTLPGMSVTFQWSTGSCVAQYYLYVGSTAGGNDIYGQGQGTNTSGTVSNLPVDGRTLFVRLWSLYSGVWHFNDYSYTAYGASGCSSAAGAIMTSPVPGTTLPGASVTFQWSTGSCVAQYYLYVGNSAGANDIYGQSQGTNTSGTVPNLPVDGRTLYVRLWSFFSAAWHFNDYTYTAF
jgi:hypothetical protein